MFAFMTMELYSQKIVHVVKMVKIVLEANAEIQDLQLREWFEKMQVQIETINERTKEHTKKIKELEKK